MNTSFMWICVLIMWTHVCPYAYMYTTVDWTTLYALTNDCSSQHSSVCSIEPNSTGEYGVLRDLGLTSLEDRESSLQEAWCLRLLQTRVGKFVRDFTTLGCGCPISGRGHRLHLKGRWLHRSRETRGWSGSGRGVDKDAFRVCWK